MKIILTRGDKIVIQTPKGATLVITCSEVGWKCLSLTAEPGRDETNFHMDNLKGSLTVVE